MSKVRIVPRLAILAGLSMLLVLLAASTSAQQTAKLKGVVYDQQDAVVTRASIRIESNIQKHAIESDDFGRFEIDVPFGSYEVTIESSGFKKHVLKGFQLKADANPELIVHLEALPTLPHPYILFDAHIEIINAPVPEKIGPRKLQ